jgi:hypothetical protein
MIGDGRKQLLLVFAVERGLAHQHLVQQHAEGPPVDGLAVWLVMDNLEWIIG